MITRRRIACFLFGFVLGGVAAAELWLFAQSRQSEPPLLKADAGQLAATTVVPCIDQPLEPNKNVVWCSTFQLVWNEACRYAGGDVHLDDEPPIVASLNQKKADLAEVDADSCVLMSGLVQENIVQKIRGELRRKFHDAASPDLLNRLEPSLPVEGWLAYAYLSCELAFEHRFQRLSEPLNFAGTPVMAFGVKRDASYKQKAKAIDQILSWDYQSKDDFIVELIPREKNERILLAKMPPAATLEKNVETALMRASDDGKTRHGSPFGWNDALITPILNFDLLQEYRPLKDKKIVTPGPLKDNPIVAAMQTVRFRLDERGALLKSEAAMPACAAGLAGPRAYVFDAPFLILLVRRNAARPYLAIWVDNAELLAKLEPKKD